MDTCSRLEEPGGVGVNVGRLRTTTRGKQEEVAASNGTIAVFAQRQVYAPTMNFKYQIDQSQPPKAAALLIDDERFKPTN
jgi:hypothetical protein